MWSQANTVPVTIRLQNPDLCHYYRIRNGIMQRNSLNTSSPVSFSWFSRWRWSWSRMSPLRDTCVWSWQARQSSSPSPGPGRRCGRWSPHCCPRYWRSSRPLEIKCFHRILSFFHSWKWDNSTDTVAIGDALWPYISHIIKAKYFRDTLRHFWKVPTQTKYLQLWQL